MIFQNALLEWRNLSPFADDAQVEQDLILSAILVSMYEDDTLRQKLAFRGGTCLYKLFFKTPLRYSEDLDFVQVNPEKMQQMAATQDIDGLQEMLACVQASGLSGLTIVS